MRVMFGTFSAATVLGGGVMVQVRSLHRELGRRGVEVELFDPWKPYRLADYDLLHLFGAHVGTYHLGRSLASLGMRLVLSPVFFSRHPASRVAALVAVAKRLRKRGGFWTEHMFAQELCDMADLVLPNTQAEADLVANAFGVSRSKIGLLPNGVDERFAAATPDAFVERFGVRDFVLYVGHIGWGRKNVLPLLEACRDLACRTVLIGEVIDNDYGRQCLKLIRESDRMLHIPAVEPESGLLASAYAACDTLVLPGYYETPGLAALEAGLAGAKVCVTRFGGTAEYFGEFATYLDPHSRQSIRDAVAASLARPKSNRLSEHVRARFLWGEAARQLAASYDKLLAG